MHHERTADVAKGRWKGILLTLGIPESVLRDKHGPCPICKDGKDRFRWDNKQGSGSYYCSVCGAGDGMKLAMEFTGKTFAEIAAEIDQMVGNIKPDTGRPRQEMTDDDRRRELRAVWVATKPVTVGDLAHKYLESRGVGELIYPDALRFGTIKDGMGGIRPCMVGIVSDVAGVPCQLHRTFLRPDGLAKAEMEAPRKMMPGTIPDGAAIRLSEFKGGTLGIAEGIETAMSASAMYGVPVWSAINSTILAKWVPPEGCEEVVVFADNDPAFGGQAAAYALAHRIAAKLKIPVTVQVPDFVGKDYNDLWLAHCKARRPG